MQFPLGEVKARASHLNELRIAAKFQRKVSQNRALLPQSSQHDLAVGKQLLSETLYGGPALADRGQGHLAIRPQRPRRPSHGVASPTHRGKDHLPVRPELFTSELKRVPILADRSKGHVAVSRKTLLRCESQKKAVTLHLHHPRCLETGVRSGGHVRIQTSILRARKSEGRPQGFTIALGRCRVRNGEGPPEQLMLVARVARRGWIRPADADASPDCLARSHLDAMHRTERVPAREDEHSDEAHRPCLQFAGELLHLHVPPLCVMEFAFGEQLEMHGCTLPTTFDAHMAHLC
mmetsp:Transcript_43184/g.119443  ORF Transcript_43184/g.119443 Transcript_43184/m.119443 type:complete len:292 (-) Transcript_43184:217-1092(-)